MKSQKGPTPVVLVFPGTQVGGELPRGSETDPAIELFLIGAMTALHFPVGLSTARGIAAVLDAQVGPR